MVQFTHLSHFLGDNIVTMELKWPNKWELSTQFFQRFVWTRDFWFLRIDIFLFLLVLQYLSIQNAFKSYQHDKQQRWSNSSFGICNCLQIHSLISGVGVVELISWVALSPPTLYLFGLILYLLAFLIDIMLYTLWPSAVLVAILNPEQSASVDTILITDPLKWLHQFLHHIHLQDLPIESLLPPPRLATFLTIALVLGVPRWIYIFLFPTTPMPLALTHDQSAVFDNISSALLRHDDNKKSASVSPQRNPRSKNALSELTEAEVFGLSSRRTSVDTALPLRPGSYLISSHPDLLQGSPATAPTAPRPARKIYKTASTHAVTKGLRVERYAKLDLNGASGTARRSSKIDLDMSSPARRVDSAHVTRSTSKRARNSDQ